MGNICMIRKVFDAWRIWVSLIWTTVCPIVMMSAMWYWFMSCLIVTLCSFLVKAQRTFPALTHSFPKKIYAESETWWNHVWDIIIVLVLHCKPPKVSFLSDVIQKNHTTFLLTGWWPPCNFIKTDALQRIS